MKEEQSENFFVNGDSLKLWDDDLPQSLSQEENLRLLREYRQAKDEATKNKLRDQIVYGNLCLVIKIFSDVCYGYCRDRWKREDMLQESVWTILQAIESFDPDKDVAFSSYLTACITNDLRTQHRLMTYKCRSGETVALSEKMHSSRKETSWTYEEALEEEYFDEDWMLSKLDYNLVMEKILPKFSEFEQRVFKKNFVDGKSQNIIAQEEGMSHQYISKILKRMVCEVVDIYRHGKDAHISKRNAASKWSGTKKTAAGTARPHIKER